MGVFNTWANALDIGGLRIHKHYSDIIVNGIVIFFFSTFFIAFLSTYSVASFFRFSLIYAICILSLFLYHFLYLSSFAISFQAMQREHKIKIFQLNLNTDSFVVRLPHTYSSL